MRKDIAYIDVARCIAILCVVACHAIEIDYYFVRFGKIEFNTASWIFQNVIFTIGRLGVPLFLMITGALMLGREYSIKKFYLHSFLPILATTEIWIVINYIFVNYDCFSKRDLLKEILFLKAPEMNHMWYMPMILGFYLIIPFLSKAIKGCSIKSILFPLIVSGIVFWCIPFFNAFAGEVFVNLSDVAMSIDVSFLGGGYAAYIIIGYYIAKEGLLEKIKSWGLIIVGCVAFAANSIFAYYFLNNQLFHTDLFGYYQSPFILILGIVVFEFIRRYLDRESRMVKIIARYSFGIYLLHNIFLQIIVVIFEKVDYTSDVNIIVKFIIRFFAPLLLSILICKIFDLLFGQKTKKILLLMK